MKTGVTKQNVESQNKNNMDMECISLDCDVIEHIIRIEKTRYDPPVHNPLYHDILPCFIPIL